MATEALVVARMSCVLCGAEVPSPLVVCLACGAGPLVAGRQGNWSVTVEPVPSMKLRAEVADLLASLSADLAREDVEPRLREGQPPLWVSGRLDEETARALQERLRRMHVVAHVHRGRPPGAPAWHAVAHPLPVLAALVGIGAAVFGAWATAIVALAAAVAFAAFRHRRLAVGPPLLDPPVVESASPELDAAIRALVRARQGVPEAVGRVASRLVDAVRGLVTRLGDPDDPVAYVAGGLSGDIAHRTARLLEHAAGVLRDRPGEPAAGALEQAAAELHAVADELASLAQHAEADAAGRLQACAARIEAAADRLAAPRTPAGSA